MFEGKTDEKYHDDCMDKVRDIISHDNSFVFYSDKEHPNKKHKAGDKKLESGIYTDVSHFGAVFDYIPNGISKFPANTDRTYQKEAQILLGAEKIKELYYNRQLSKEDTATLFKELYGLNIDQNGRGGEIVPIDEEHYGDNYLAVLAAACTPYQFMTYEYTSISHPNHDAIDLDQSRWLFDFGCYSANIPSFKDTFHMSINDANELYHKTRIAKYEKQSVETRKEWIQNHVMSTAEMFQIKDTDPCVEIRELTENKLDDILHCLVQAYVPEKAQYKFLPEANHTQKKDKGMDR